MMQMNHKCVQVQQWTLAMEVPEIVLKSKISEMLGWLCFVVKGKAEIRDQFSKIYEPLPMY